jgi:hypothetical protein
MEFKLKLNNVFKSSVKGTFVSATSTTFLAALLATSLYVNDNHSNPLAVLSGYYLSLRGISLGVLVPVYVGIVTAGIVLISTRITSKLKSSLALKNLSLLFLVIAYVPVIFSGSLVILYFGS